MFNTVQPLIMRQCKHFQNQHNKFTQDKRFFQSTINAFMYSVESFALPISIEPQPIYFNVSY